MKQIDIMNGESQADVAHLNKVTGEIQTLENHLRGTAALSAVNASKIGLDKVGHLIGLLHDVGKASQQFQDYIRDLTPQFSRGDIDHSTAGAQYLFRKQAAPIQENQLKI